MNRRRALKQTFGFSAAYFISKGYLPAAESTAVADTSKGTMTCARKRLSQMA
jgi:hypothetical protein